MINFIVCDDNSYVRTLVESIISKVAMPYDFDYKVYSFEKYDSKMKALIHSSSDIKVYILDLELPNKSGIDIANEIRKVDWDSVIIISTSHNELELKILKQRLLIFDFISKFDDYEKRLSDTLNLIINKVGTKKYLSFRSNKELHHLNSDNILYIYRNNESGKTTIVTNEEKYEVRESLSYLVNKLDKRFVQSHRACYINRDKVKSIDFKNNIIYFNNGMKLDYLSRNYKKGLRMLLWV